MTSFRIIFPMLAPRTEITRLSSSKCFERWIIIAKSYSARHILFLKLPTCRFNPVSMFIIN